MENFTFKMLINLSDHLKVDVPTLDPPPAGFTSWLEFYNRAVMTVLYKAQPEIVNEHLLTGKPLPSDWRIFGLESDYVQQQVNLERHKQRGGLRGELNRLYLSAIDDIDDNTPITEQAFARLLDFRPTIKR